MSNPCVALSDQYIRTSSGRLSWPSLFEKEESSDVAPEKWKYASTLIFGPDADLSVLRKKIEEVATKAFGPAGLSLITDQTRIGLRDGITKISKEDGSYSDGFGPGTFFIKARTAYQPPVVNHSREAISDPSVVVPGSFAKFVIKVFSYEKPQRGIGLQLEGVQLLGGGQRFASGSKGVSPTDVFEEASNLGATALAPDSEQAAPPAGSTGNW